LLNNLSVKTLIFNHFFLVFMQIKTLYNLLKDQTVLSKTQQSFYSCIFFRFYCFFCTCSFLTKRPTFLKLNNMIRLTFSFFQIWEEKVLPDDFFKKIQFSHFYITGDFHNYVESFLFFFFTFF